MGYFSWGSTDPQNRVRAVKMDFVPGAIGATFVSTDARTFKEPPADWGSGYLTVVKSEGLAPGATTNAITLQSPKGYTGEEAPLVMMKNSNFVDGTVDLLAKYSSGQWQSIHKRPIDRTLLSQ